MCARLRILGLLAPLFASCVRTPEHDVAAKQPSPTTPTEHGDDDSAESRIQARLRSLMVHPWSQWRKGTTIVRGFVPHGRGADIAEYLQPDLTYEIVEHGQRFERRQTVDGKITTQSFAMHPDDGLPKPFSGAPVANEPFAIDGATVPGIRRTIEGPTHGDAPPVITTQWTLARDEQVLLRRETDGGTSWWVVEGIDRPKTIDGRVFLCVEIRQRVGTAEQYVVTTTFLSPEVPGHVVEEIKEYYDARKGGTPHMVTIERALRFTR